jgi:hypothetical protein
MVGQLTVTARDLRRMLDEDEEAFFWRSYWEAAVCCRPQLTGDYTSVWRVSDYLSDRQLAHSIVGEWFRLSVLISCSSIATTNAAGQASRT